MQTTVNSIAQISRDSSARAEARRRALSRTEASRIRNLRALRKRTERAARLMHTRTRKLTLTLVARGLTIRDVGALLGISYQRVQQIMKGQ